MIDLAQKLLAREFGSDLLAGISVITAVLLGEYLVGAIVVLMLSGGAVLEHYATRRASVVLDALARRMPTVAHRKTPTGVTDIGLSKIAVGETLIVLPHEICPVDGTVVSGHGSMDESYLTGEPFEISKTPGSEVLSGAVNGESVIVIVASRLPVDSRYAKIMQVMRASDVRQESAQARTLYVDDGINDAPAMMTATVGVAFGKDSDITAEAADAVGGMAQEVIDLPAVLNAVHVAMMERELTDF